MRLGAPIAAFALFAVTTGAAVGVGASGVHVALLPTENTVAPGTEFDVRIVVTEPGPDFNAYDAVIVYDARALTFVDRPASQQEGIDMVSACGSTFHVFVPSEGRLQVSHSLLCPDTSLSGPDELYVLRFQAGAQSERTPLAIDDITFANAGTPVPTESVEGTSILIANPTDAVPTRRGRFQLQFVPNPFISTTTVFFDAPRNGFPRIVVHNANGRLVRELHTGFLAAGVHRFAWDAVDIGGNRLPCGVYFISAIGDDYRVAERVILLK